MTARNNPRINPAFAVCCIFVEVMIFGLMRVNSSTIMIHQRPNTLRYIPLERERKGWCTHLLEKRHQKFGAYIEVKLEKIISLFGN
jgi:hypothetical protein